MTNLRTRDNYGSTNSRRFWRLLWRITESENSVSNRMSVHFIRILSQYKYTLAALISSIQILLIDFPIQDLAMKGWLVSVVYPTVIILYALSFKVVHQLAIMQN
jgi:hypothetical protein